MKDFDRDVAFQLPLFMSVWKNGVEKHLLKHIGHEECEDDQVVLGTIGDELETATEVKYDSTISNKLIKVMAFKEDNAITRR
jgi:hypothetical protein